MSSISSKAKITAIGTYVPQRTLTNADLEKMVDTNDEWIVRRTGIRERRISQPEEFTTDLCVAAIENLIERYNKSVKDVDLIIVSTTTPDYVFPSVASQIQARLGIENAGALDLNATCAGFVYGLHLANGVVTAGLNKKVLVLGGETLSKVTDYSDRTTCILFGDGAGAVLVEYDEENPSFLSSYLTSAGEGGVHLYRTGLSKKMDLNELNDSGYIVQNGREVYRWAVTTVPLGMKALMEKSRLDLKDIDWFVPHSANLRMIESICEKSGFPIEKTLTSIEYFGNTSSATIPLALEKGIMEGKLQPGDRVLLYGFGGGLVQAGLIVEWTAS
ncbi:ketoacyl-ACP synthase III [Aneurinibacillus terranovensis]|uniref:ketoacyl-ACP synthase III n=1 Tax=Aneurinibacillus terranovensis TaxID=278991 RepID=UPI000425DE7E|nr:ketoacyl-ACP synthase III [Aneurinibacillus terranovensis]